VAGTKVRFQEGLNGTWRAQISFQGSRISFGAATKQECQAWIRMLQPKLDQGWDYRKSLSSLEDYLELWLQNSRPTLRPKTAYQYEQIIGKHIKPKLGSIAIKDISTEQIERFYSQLLAQNVGIRTIRLCHLILHRAFEKAVIYGMVLRNPCQGASLPRYQHQEMCVFDGEQTTRFLVACSQSRFEALFHLAVVTGMRQAELFGLQWGDLKWQSGTLYVKWQVQQVPGQKWQFVDPKTKAGRRTIRLGTGTLEFLRPFCCDGVIVDACNGKHHGGLGQDERNEINNRQGGQRNGCGKRCGCDNGTPRRVSNGTAATLVPNLLAFLAIHHKTV